jgi:hypothetical protein
MHPLFLMSIISEAELPASVHSVRKSTLQSLEMKKEISFLFCQNFYIISPRFWQAGQQLEPCSQTCQNIIFQIPKFKR